VKTFSQPLNVEMDINPNIYRPDYGRNVMAGDTLPVWSLNDSSGTWKSETFAIVVAKPNGGLKATFQQQHLSWWAINDPNCWHYIRVGRGGRWVYQCNCPSAQINITSDFTTRYDVQARFVLGNNNAGYIPFQVQNIQNGQVIHLSNIAQSSSGVLQLADLQGNILYSSAPIQPCNGVTVDLRGQLPTPPPTITLNFSALCSGSTAKAPSATIYPSVTIYYKDLGQNSLVSDRLTWQVLGGIVHGQGTTSGLIPGHYYKFGVFHGSLSRTTDDLGLKGGFLMPNGDATIAVVSPVYGISESFTIKKTGNAYNLNYLNFPIPASLCNDYKKYF